jgi:hypothetical protein
LQERRFVQVGIPEVTIEGIEAIPSDLALPDALAVIQDASNNAETQFSNLNTRGVAILSATSLVTALAGFYAKDILGTTYMGWRREVGIAGLVLTLAWLSIVAVIVVVCVLKPTHRLFFGDNDITDRPTGLTSALEVKRVAFKEYRQVLADLYEKNQKKAIALKRAYWSFLAAVVSIALTVAIITVANY